MPGMSIVYGLLVVLHLIGMASVVGSYLVTARAPKVLPGMLHGALTALVTGVILVGLRSSGAYDSPDGDVDNTKIGVKLLVALGIVALAWRYRRRDAPAGVVHAIGGLAVLNVAVAVLWT
jgi:hypothetical protein